VGGGFDVGYLKAGEWMNYTVNVTKTGTFNLDTRLASAFSGAAFTDSASVEPFVDPFCASSGTDVSSESSARS